MQYRKIGFGLSLLIMSGVVSACHSSHTSAEAPARDGRADATSKAYAVGGPGGAVTAEEPVADEAVQEAALEMEAQVAPAMAPPPGRMPAAAPTATNQGTSALGAGGVVEKKEKAGPLAERQDGFNTEAYDRIVENRFVSTATAPLSTFSIDVDTASYSNVRRFLSQEQAPPPGAVRIEELINYFDYDYAEPRGDQPFAVHAEVGPAPWAPEHKLLHIGLQGKKVELSELPPRNLVFLVDVSGSMQDEAKLPLLKRSFRALLDTMGEKDTVSIAVYAGASGLVLPPTRAHRSEEIFGALERLEAGGSTNGAAGIELAYRTARRAFRPGGINRVILATDGDFNVGTTNQSELIRLIEKERESGVFLTVLGFGMGNYKDSTLEKLADHGNGNYAYIDSLREARKVLVEQGGANLFTIAKDVKIQLELNPQWVGAYRLVGYENRMLEAEDFNDDKKDAGEIGAGHTVTALYELLSPEQARRELSVDGLKYQAASSPTGRAEELATIKLRYKAPSAHRSRLLEVPVRATSTPLASTSEAFRFSSAVAAFGMLLRGSEHRGHSSYGLVANLARGALGPDPHGHRREFLGLVDRARHVTN